jgi:MFS family permease
MPLYLQQVFGVSYRMVTLIPMVFGAGKWVASLPTGLLLDRLGRRGLMAGGLVVIASCDVASLLASGYVTFLGWRALAGVGWAMFATVATTVMVDRSTAQGRGRAVSALLLSEQLGLLLGTAGGGWLYQSSPGSPFAFEAACMLVGALAVSRWDAGPATPPTPSARIAWRELRTARRLPALVAMSVTNGVLIAVHTGAVVFLVPLYLLNRAHVGPAAVGLLVGTSVAGRLLALWLAGGVASLPERRRALPHGLLAYAVLLGSLPWLAHPVALGVWSLALGAAAGFVAPLPTAILGDSVAPSQRGLAVGILRTVTDTGQILGPLALGTLADAGDLSAVFAAGAVSLAAAAWGCHRHAARSPAPIEGPDRAGV